MFGFGGYQLNTSQLWKPVEASSISNYAFLNRNFPLYEGIENGKVQDFNDSVFETLLKFFMLAPSDMDGVELYNCERPSNVDITKDMEHPDTEN